MSAPHDDPMLATAAGQADLDAALLVWREANAARQKVPDAQRISRVRRKLADRDAVVVLAWDRRTGRAIGMALAEPGRDDDGSGAVLPGLCHVSMVFVHPDHWGNRVGARLLDAVEGQARQRGQLRLQLWTGASNHRAQRLYRRAGFEPTGHTKQLPTGERVIQLARPLGP